MPLVPGESVVWPQAGGETGDLIRQRDWSATPLGPIEKWPQNLRTAVDLTLSAPVAAILLWGPDHLQIYNDLWKVPHASRHPAALGQRTHDCFVELEEALDPVYQRVWGGEGVLLQDTLLPVIREGVLQDAWWNVVYTPVRGKFGAVEGIYCTLVETTAKVLAERVQQETKAVLDLSEERQAFVLRLSDALRPLADPRDIQAAAMRMLGEHLRVERAIYYRALLEDGIWVHYVDSDWYNLPEMSPIAGRFPLSNFRLELFADLDKGSPVIVPDVRLIPRITPRELKAYRAITIGAFVAVPIVKSGMYVGGISVQTSAPRRWTEEEISVVHEVAERTWADSERARVEDALRESEQQFRLFVENVREYALVQTDFEGIVTSWNPGAERLFGYGSAEIVGKPFAMLLPEKDRHEGLIAREMAILSRGERNLDAHSVQRKDGSCFWAEWITEPVMDDTGALRGTAKVMRDETERQRAEGALRSSLAEKDSLLSEVHHRVKNNLQVITSLLNLQSRDVEDSSVLRLFEETRNRVQSIASIHELLYRSSTFARINLVDYAQRVVHGLVRFYNAESRVDVRIEGKDASLELERAVPFGLLLNELAANALKHGLPEPQSGLLTIRLQRESGSVLLNVSDTGQGLPVEFQRREPASLGLRLVYMLATQLNAEIAFESRPGLTVTVRIPVGQASANDG